MSGSRSSFRRLLPAVLFLGAAGGLAAIGVRMIAGERAVAERTAREGLRGRARDGAGRLVAAAATLARRAALGEPDAIAGPDGTFLSPAPPRPFSSLGLVRGRDPEGTFYLAAGERAEAADGDPKRAIDLYRAAAAEGRDPGVRKIALYRLAALHRRGGDGPAARAAEAAFLALLAPGDRRTLEAVIVRARARPADPDLARDLLVAVGSPDEALALGLLADAGLDDPAALAARREELRRLHRYASLLAGPVAAGDDGAIADGRLVAFARDADGRVRFAEGPLPRLPDGVRIAGADDLGRDVVAETVPAGDPLPGVSVRAATDAREVRAAATGRAMWLAAALAVLVLAGAAALVLGVRAARREAAADREKAAFATRVGHDLRTPLALIRMYAETIAAGKVDDPEQAREFAGIAAREAERLSGLVGEVLDLSRVAEGNGAISRRPLDLAVLARDVAEAHRPLVERAGMRLAVRAAAPVPVVGDAAALRGAVANLLENAIRHAAVGGEIEVACEAEGGRTVLTVADRGPGIPDEIRGTLFERFVRGPRADSPGAGLGLALVREVARAHGGEADAADRDGGGAALTIRLPRGDEPEGERA